jgi:hypothetical protein
MGLPHSKTLARRFARHYLREVLECGCPLPLSLLPPARPHCSVPWPHAALIGVRALLASAATSQKIEVAR